MAHIVAVEIDRRHRHTEGSGKGNDRADDDPALFHFRYAFLGR